MARATSAKTNPNKKARRSSFVKGGKTIYFFGTSRCDGNKEMKGLLGGKGAYLAAMTRIGLPVPPGFTITTEICTYYYQNGNQFPPNHGGALARAVKWLEKETGKKFGDPHNPLLLSIRSGSRDSMPGMMDTILNLGLNGVTTEGLSAAVNNGRFAWDAYRRFVQMYGEVVMGVQKRHENEPGPFDEMMDQLKREVGALHDTDLNEADLKELVQRYKALIKQRTGKMFPVDPVYQLERAVKAVIGSWMNERAVLYRQKNAIPQEWGTAVTVQSMVFGNLGDDCASGVAFTRDPATGDNALYGEYLVNAQGEDVVAGFRTPKKISEMAEDPALTATFNELDRVRNKLERYFGDAQDFEFTIERKKLFLLQTRNAKRTALAYVKIAHDMLKEGLMTPEYAIASGDPKSLNQLLQPIFNRCAYEQAQKECRLLVTGLAAGPGAASGAVVFSGAKAEELCAQGTHVVLARVETSPEDLRGMIASDGILTCRGGVSSHAALVARQMGKVCITGAGEMHIDYRSGKLTCGGLTVNEGEPISINGSTGEVFRGPIATTDSELKQVLITKTLDVHQSHVFRYYDALMKLADKYRKLGIRANADQPDQVACAVAFGAEGIGLCRTEHMFFQRERIVAVRQMILADNDVDRKAALALLLPHQQRDFEGIFRVLNGRPACIRLLDPPLHEFLPQHDNTQGQQEVAAQLKTSIERVRQRVNELHELNPMLGFRGCRLGIKFPEISKMQVRAIFQAAAVVLKEGIKVKPEIMIPLVGFKKELDLQIEIIHRIARDVMKEMGMRFPYSIGTMIEVPRGALTADEIAESAEFFSFGTNDLTQMCLGMSRDDSGSFLPAYQAADIVKNDPFASIDVTGVGQLMRISVEKGRKKRADLKIGICGEHGGDPSSIKFCDSIGLNYVSCSPLRIPIARLAAAQAALNDGK
jgi:pyruvate,orthophosphate dikinase